eukprot:TRINITY_DN7440_c0_g1_i1.p1 TRINITY_DN7440_c0_g1~~TRINITY_DN7440_c0_g1_i1.p1  ORF type:complete len:381 (-),score=70.09 TRINITY_DN7440_c0_g1_i1:450-1541(-)
MKQKGLRPTVITYTALISACADDPQKAEMALTFFDEMQRTGTRPNEHTFCAVLCACGVTGQIEKALDVFSNMHQSGCSPNVYTYTALITALAKSNLVEGALAKFSEMKMNGVEPSSRTYCSLIHACGKLGMTVAAWDLFTEMRHKGLKQDEVIYGCILCALRNDAKKALEVFAEMKARGLVASAFMYNSVMAACVQCGMPQTALSILEELKQQGMKPDLTTVGSILDARSEGKVCEANLQLQCWAERDKKEFHMNMASGINSTEQPLHRQGEDIAHDVPLPSSKLLERSLQYQITSCRSESPCSDTMSKKLQAKQVYWLEASSHWDEIHTSSRWDIQPSKQGCNKMPMIGEVAGAHASCYFSL